MSFNSSSPYTSVPPSLPLLSSVSVYSIIYSCSSTTTGTYVITSFTISSFLLLLPLYIFILHLGHQRWRQQCNNVKISHSDLFTYHMVIIELMSVFGSLIICLGLHISIPQMVAVGVYLLSVNLTGQKTFHVLTCVERYLAVVHPISYRRLREKKGLRIRNITIGCAWLLSLAGTAQLCISGHVFIVTLVFFSSSLTIFLIFFCSLSVLCVLIRPGPGDGGGGRKQVDQTKLRVFYTIMAILGVLMFRFMGSILSTSLYASQQLEEWDKCGLWWSTIWLGLPSSLVLPLLFLQRAGKLVCCKSSRW